MDSITAPSSAITLDEKLAQERALLRYIIDNIPYVIFWKDRSSVFGGCNKNFAALSGHADPNEVVGKTDSDMPWRAHAAEYRAFDLDTMRRGEPILGKEERISSPAGGEQVILTSKVPLRNDAGDVVGVLGMIVDITDRKRIEEELQRAKEAAEQGTRVRSEFIANISHELRTPLTLILGPVKEALRDPEMTSGTRQVLERVQRNALRLYNLVNGVLDFSKAEAGRTAVRRELIDLIASTGAVVSDMQPLARARQIDLDFSAATDSLVAALDIRLVERILLNLIGNALKFTPAGGRVQVLVARDGGEIRLAVADTGVGIPAEAQSRLFQPFAQLDSTATRRHEGTGLGLALVKHFAEALGGSVGVVSKEGAGSTFTVRLPIQASLDGAPAAAPSSADESDVALGSRAWQQQAASLAPVEATSPASAGPLDERPRVLVADDNPDLRVYIGDTLRREFCVTTVEDGRQAWERLQTHRFDLVVSDVMMPELDGIGLTRRIKSHAALAHLPVILLTARGGAEATASGLDAGADDYLAKPFDADELCARVRAAVRMCRLQEELRIKSRQAGMATVADGVMHNIGNVLNAITVSSGLVGDAIRGSLVGGVEKLAGLLSEHSPDLATFLTKDERGKQIPAYLTRLAKRLMEERDSVAREVARLQEGIKHAASVVSSHRSMTSAATVDELFAPVEAAEAALRLSLPPGRYQEIRVEQRFEEVPLLRGDKNKVLQILINLLSNARQALQASPHGDKQLHFSTEREGSHIRFVVTDNGIGIAPDTKTKLFRQRFSTRPDGSGLGLHTSALLAEQIGASLRAHSEGEGRGATFVLELPLPVDHSAVDAPSKVA